MMFTQIEAEGLSAVDPGEFRDDDAFIGYWRPVGANLLDQEMQKFVELLRNGVKMVSAGQMHAVELAALAHYYFVCFLL